MYNRYTLLLLVDMLQSAQKIKENTKEIEIETFVKMGKPKIQLFAILK
jgi:hypothetical protein